MTNTENNYSIKLSTLGLIIGTFAVGYVSAYIFNNQGNNETVTLSTMEIINFVISILLSTSSLVLAVLAINLGKSSEKMMVDRSDESIKLQNEVFTKTIEALGRIESSTGVTEKRIEDIISGRAGDIADRLLSDKIVHRGDKKLLEDEIRAALRAELNQTSKVERQNKQEEEKRIREEAWKKYSIFKEQILLAIANTDGVKALRISDGQFVGEREELVDGLFEKDGIRIGVCTFSGDKSISSNFLSKELDEFINRLATEIAKSTFAKVYLIFDEETGTTEKYKSTLHRIKQTMKEDISSNISLIVSKPEEILNKI